MTENGTDQKQRSFPSSEAIAESALRHPRGRRLAVASYNMSLTRENSTLETSNSTLTTLLAMQQQTLNNLTNTLSARSKDAFTGNNRTSLASERRNSSELQNVSAIDEKLLSKTQQPTSTRFHYSSVNDTSKLPGGTSTTSNVLSPKNSTSNMDFVSVYLLGNEDEDQTRPQKLADILGNQSTDVINLISTFVNNPADINSINSEPDKGKVESKLSLLEHNSPYHNMNIIDLLLGPSENMSQIDFKKIETQYRSPKKLSFADTVINSSIENNKGDLEEASDDISVRQENLSKTRGRANLTLQQSSSQKMMSTNDSSKDATLESNSPDDLKGKNQTKFSMALWNLQQPEFQFFYDRVEKTALSFCNRRKIHTFEHLLTENGTFSDLDVSI